MEDYLKNSIFYIEFELAAYFGNGKYIYITRAKDGIEITYAYTKDGALTFEKNNIASWEGEVITKTIKDINSHIWKSIIKNLSDFSVFDWERNYSNNPFFDITDGYAWSFIFRNNKSEIVKKIGGYEKYPENFENVVNYLKDMCENDIGESRYYFSRQSRYHFLYKDDLLNSFPSEIKITNNYSHLLKSNIGDYVVILSEIDGIINDNAIEEYISSKLTVFYGIGRIDNISNQNELVIKWITKFRNNKNLYGFDYLVASQKSIHLEDNKVNEDIIEYLIGDKKFDYRNRYYLSIEKNISNLLRNETNIFKKYLNNFLMYVHQNAHYKQFDLLLKEMEASIKEIGNGLVLRWDINGKQEQRRYGYIECNQILMYYDYECSILERPGIFILSKNYMKGRRSYIKRIDYIKYDSWFEVNNNRMALEKENDYFILIDTICKKEREIHNHKWINLDIGGKDE